MKRLMISAIVASLLGGSAIFAQNVPLDMSYKGRPDPSSVAVLSAPLTTVFYFAAHENEGPWLAPTRNFDNLACFAKYMKGALRKEGCIKFVDGKFVYSGDLSETEAYEVVRQAVSINDDQFKK